MIEIFGGELLVIKDGKDCGMERSMLVLLSGPRIVNKQSIPLIEKSSEKSYFIVNSSSRVFDAGQKFTRRCTQFMSQQYFVFSRVRFDMESDCAKNEFSFGLGKHSSNRPMTVM